MNYIKQLNAFYDWVLLNSITPKEQALYLAILNMNNKCGWKKEFTIANQTLQAICPMSKSELHKSRNDLKQKGLIGYEKGRKGQAGTYHIIPLYETNMETNLETNMETNMETNLETKVEDIIKHKQKHKQNNKSPYSPPKGEDETSDGKIEYAEYVRLTEKEYEKLTQQLGEKERDRLMMEYGAWISGQTSRVQKKRSAYLTILNWHRRDSERRGTHAKPKPSPSRSDFDYTALSL